MPAEYVRDYSKILQGGIWCIMSIEYRHPWMRKTSLAWRSLATMRRAAQGQAQKARTRGLSV